MHSEGLQFPCTSKPEAHKSSTNDLSSRSLEKNDKTWFIDQFVKSFMESYSDKNFEISTPEGNKLLLTDSEESNELKKKWLRETAEDEFNDYVENKKDNYLSLALFDKEGPVGCLLYQIEEISNSIYIGQLFTSSGSKRRGIGAHIIKQLLPKQALDCKIYELLVRHQNHAAITFYTKLGFKEDGDNLIVAKHNMDKNRYKGLYYVVPNK